MVCGQHNHDKPPLAAPGAVKKKEKATGSGRAGIGRPPKQQIPSAVANQQGKVNPLRLHGLNVDSPGMSQVDSPGGPRLPSESSQFEHRTGGNEEEINAEGAANPAEPSFGVAMLPSPSKVVFSNDVIGLMLARARKQLEDPSPSTSPGGALESSPTTIDMKPTERHIPPKKRSSAQVDNLSNDEGVSKKPKLGLPTLPIASSTVRDGGAMAPSISPKHKAQTKAPPPSSPGTLDALARAALQSVGLISPSLSPDNASVPIKIRLKLATEAKQTHKCDEGLHSGQKRSRPSSIDVDKDGIDDELLDKLKREKILSVEESLIPTPGMRPATGSNLRAEAGSGPAPTPETPGGE